MEDEADSRLPAEQADDDGDSDWVSTMDAVFEEFVDIEHTPFGDFGFPDTSEVENDYIDYDQVNDQYIKQRCSEAPT